MQRITQLLAPALAIRATSFYRITPAKPTVASALAGLNKVVNDLRKVKEHHDAEESKHTRAALSAEVAREEAIQKAEREAAEKIAAANTAATAASAEAAKAARTVAKFEELLGL